MGEIFESKTFLYPFSQQANLITPNTRNIIFRMNFLFLRIAFSFIKIIGRERSQKDPFVTEEKTR